MAGEVALFDQITLRCAEEVGIFRLEQGGGGFHVFGILTQTDGFINSHVHTDNKLLGVTDLLKNIRSFFVIRQVLVDGLQQDLVSWETLNREDERVIQIEDLLALSGP